MDEDKWGRVSNAVDGTSVSGKTGSFVDADTPPTPQDNGKKIYLGPQVHQKSLLESPSSSVSPPKSVTVGLPQKDKCLPTRKRSADESLESLITPRKVKSQLDPSISQTVLPTSCVATSPLLVSNSKDVELSSPKEDTFNVQHFADLISIIKALKHAEAGASASPQNVVEGSHVPHPSTKKVGRQDSDVRKSATNPKLPSATSVASKEDQPVGNKAATEERVPFRSVGTNDTIEKQPEKDVDAQSTVQNEAPVAFCPGVAGDQNSGQISRPQSEVDSTVCQTHINCTKVNGGHQLAHCVSAPASDHCSHSTQTVKCTNEQVSSSAEPEDANTSNTPLVYNANVHNPESNSPALFYPNQINARQAVNSCVHLGSQKTPGNLGLEVQQQQQMQQQMQQLLHQQQILQQQLHQCQMQQAKQQQIHQYQMYQLQQNNQEQVQQHQVQQQMHQYQMYRHRMHQYQMYWQQPSTQGQVLQQPYSQDSAGMSVAPPAQHRENWVMQNIPPFYPSP